MKIAYIMLCHKNPDQINKMIEVLDDGDNDFYIHIDKKSNIKQSIKVSENVFLLNDDKRISIKWGDISMIAATKNLLEAVINSNQSYGYVWLLSGQDFPLRKQQDIKDYLKKNQGKNFIEIIDEQDQNYYRLLKRNQLYYPDWMKKMTLLSRILKIIYMLLTGGLSRTLIFKRKNYLNVKFYFGSQWWVLTYDCIKEIYPQLDEYMDFYKYCLVPDESVFQTIYMTTSFQNDHNDKLTYVDWNNQMNHPKVIRESDYEEIKKSKYLMARKFDQDVDEKIIYKLYFELK